MQPYQLCACLISNKSKRADTIIYLWNLNKVNVKAVFTCHKYNMI